jgi:hypothetical protein
LEKSVMLHLFVKSVCSLSTQKENFQKNSRNSRVGTSRETLFHCKVTRPLRNRVFNSVTISKLYFNKFRILELFKILGSPGIPQKYLVLLLNVQCGHEGLIKGSWTTSEAFAVNSKVF